jgi:CheY-like chemotaxis protein
MRQGGRNWHRQPRNNLNQQLKREVWPAVEVTAKSASSACVRARQSLSVSLLGESNHSTQGSSLCLSDIGVATSNSNQMADMADHQASRYASDVERSLGGGARLPRLLVIDDDASICAVIERLGQKAGFMAKRAVSVDEAARLLRKESFDCITLDLSIGKDTGIELLSVLAETARTTPIIIISGSMRSMRDFAVSIGNKMNLAIQEPFAKPIDFAKLRETLISVRKKMGAPREVTPAA